MRQKRIKEATPDNLLALDVIMDIKLLDLASFSKVSLEIGSGKGKFITSLASDNPDELFVAFERDKSVAYRLAQKKNEMNLNNLLVVCNDAKHLNQYLTNNSLDKIYLNFSDPWPKAKHHKRRLTFHSFLMIYHNLLKENGLIEFRTDHLPFFEDSLTYFIKKFETIKIDYNLSESCYMTEYEIKKRKLMPINQYIGKKI